jgi:hypothetical protein
MIVPNSFNKILNYSILISKETRGIRCGRAEKEASVFLHKNVLSAYTLFQIINPRPNDIFPAMANGAVVYDSPSMNVIVRAMFEAYINMYYLLIDPPSEEERDFRLDRWEKHSLTERKKIASSLGSKSSVLIEDEKQILFYENRIKNSSTYKSLSPQERQSLDNSERWTKVDTINRAIIAGFHKTQAEFLYKFLSNYSHSESYSLMQLHSIKRIEEALALCNMPLKFGEMLLALSINCFAKLNDKALDVVVKNNELKILIDFWEELKQKDLTEMMKIANDK